MTVMSFAPMSKKLQCQFVVPEHVFGVFWCKPVPHTRTGCGRELSVRSRGFMGMVLRFHVESAQNPKTMMANRSKALRVHIVTPIIVFVDMWRVGPISLASPCHPFSLPATAFPYTNITSLPSLDRTNNGSYHVTMTLSCCRRFA